MFFDAERFPFTTRIEAQWQEIREEFRALPADRLSPWPEAELYNRGWEVFGLWALGHQLVDNCQLCPTTAELVATIPGLTTAGFSLLAPGARIRPHVGYTNSVLRCHLGLIVPERCSLQVGGETRQWQDGKCLVFDDTVLHSAWNESDQSRIILLIDFVREGRRFDSTVTPQYARLIQANERTNQDNPGPNR